MTDGDTSQDLRYAPPQAHVEDVAPPEAGLVLARRMHRFWAGMIDLGIAVAAIWLVSMATPWNPWADQAGRGLWTPDLVNPTVGFVLFLVIHGTLLLRRGQTVGKALLGVRIVRSDGTRATPGQLAVRYGVGYLLTIVMPVGQVYGLVDALMIFRASRRCLHDLIADTIVVKA
jgi:uncharacterized RDD family membrane protein YckC